MKSDNENFFNKSLYYWNFQITSIDINVNTPQSLWKASNNAFRFIIRHFHHHSSTSLSRNPHQINVKISFFQITCSVIGLKLMVLLVLLFFTIDDGISSTSETDVLNFHTKLMSLGMPSTSHWIWAVSPRPTLYVWTCPGRQIGATVFSVNVFVGKCRAWKRKNNFEWNQAKTFGQFP